MQVRGTPARHLPTQAHARLHVVAADHLQMRANVEAQAHERIRLSLEARGEHPRELLGNLAHVGEQQHFLVREVVVHRRAPHAGALGNLAHRDGFEGLFGHERPERIKQAGAGQLAVGGEGLANNLRPALILTSGPHMSSNGGGHHSRAAEATQALSLTLSARPTQLTRAHFGHPLPGDARRVTGCSAQPRPRQ